MVVACYCDDCQQGARQIEALSGATAVLDADGGTAYVLYRKDRFECTRGRELLRVLRLKDSSPTRRVVAGCCNSPMYLDFEKGHWVNVFRPRLGAGPPRVQMGIQGRFRRSGGAPADVPVYRAFPPKFFARLLWARIAMLFSH